MKAQFILLGAAISAGLLFAVMGTMSVANIAAQTGDGMSQGQGKGNTIDQLSVELIKINYKLLKLQNKLHFC